MIRGLLISALVAFSPYPVLADTIVVHYVGGRAVFDGDASGVYFDKLRDGRVYYSSNSGFGGFCFGEADCYTGSSGNRDGYLLYDEEHSSADGPDPDSPGGFADLSLNLFGESAFYDFLQGTGHRTYVPGATDSFSIEFDWAYYACGHCELKGFGDGPTITSVEFNPVSEPNMLSFGVFAAALAVAARRRSRRR